MNGKKAPEPNFMIAGAARAGTTTLYHYLDQHADIFMSKPCVPESKFFVYDEEFKQGKAHLLATRYAGVCGQKAVGEKTTHHMNCEGMAERIHSLFPDMKFIFLLRDPVERAISNYWWSVKNGLELLPIQAAMETEEARVARYEGKWKVIQPFSYIRRGFYMRYIREYTKYFPGGQMLFLIAEEFEENPQGVLDQVFAFLRVGRITYAAYPRLNEASRLKETDPGLIRFLWDHFRDSNQALAGYLGRELDAWQVPVVNRSGEKGRRNPLQNVNAESI